MSRRTLRLLYVANARIPGPRAHAHQTVQVCAALQSAGAEVELVHPARSDTREPLSDRMLAEFYGVGGGFRRTRLRSLDLIDSFPKRAQRPFFLVQALSFAIVVRRHIASAAFDVVYVRDPHTLFFLHAFCPAAKGRIVFEAHGFPSRSSTRALLGRALRSTVGVIAISRILARLYRELGVPGDRIVVIGSGADGRKFREARPIENVRERLAIGSEARIVCYAGSLGKEKGIDTLLESARMLGGAVLLIVGGTAADVAEARRFCAGRGLENVRFTGYVAPSDVPRYLMTADVLVAPNSGRSAASALYTSPLKFFEYASAAKPIVASDLPALRGAAAECPRARVFWAAADDPQSLAAAIREALEANEERSEADQPPAEIEWSHRAEQILAFLAKL